MFALCNQSGLDPRYRREIIRRWHRGQLRVRTDIHASPTGFPFKVAELPGTLSEEAVYLARHRSCNQRGLATPHQLPSGEIVYRCSAERVKDYLAKGGDENDVVGARCICNGLISATGLGDPGEPAIVTLGDDVSFLKHLTKDEDSSYTPAQAMTYLLGPVE